MSTSKICSTCKLEKPLSEFHKYKKSSDNHTHRCKKCVSRKKQIPIDVKICSVCGESKKICEFNKRKKGKFSVSSVCKLCNNKKKSDWKSSNKEVYLRYRRNYDKLRKQKDTTYKLICNVRSRLYDFLNERNLQKNNKTLEIVGCSPKELKAHLESLFTKNMCWENYGYYGWHVDHITPLSSAKNKEDIYKLFNYKNLQPLWGKENMKKGSKIIKNES